MPHRSIYEIQGAVQGTTDKTRRGLAVGLLVLCWLLAGSVFVAVKWAVPSTPPWMLVFFRMLLATLCLLPFASAWYRDMATRLRRHFLPIILIGSALAFTQGFMFTGLNYTTAITASIVYSIWPITAIILAALVLGERFTPWQACGVILCLGGVAVIVTQGNFARIGNLDFNAGDLWMLGAVAGMSVYTVLLKRIRVDLPPLPLLILVLAVAALASLPLFVWEILHDARTAVDWHDLVALVYMGTIGGGVMLLLYNSGVAVLGASLASVTFYLQALFTAILAYFFLGEKLHPYHMEGVALIAAGIVIVMLLRPKLSGDQGTA